jgi:hypothetical protein
LVVLVGVGVGLGDLLVLVGVGVGVGDLLVLVGVGVGVGVLVVLVGDGVGVVVFVEVGEVLGVVLLLVEELLLGLGVALFDVLLLCVGVDVVGSELVDLLADGSTVADADADLLWVVVPVGELVVGVTLAEPDRLVFVDDGPEVGLALPLVLVVPVGLAVPLALPETLAEELPPRIGRCEPVAAWRALRWRAGDLVPGRMTESSRMPALGRLAQAPFTIGGPPPFTSRVVAPNALALDARSMNPVKAPTTTGRTSRTLAVLTTTTLTLQSSASGRYRPS